MIALIVHSKISANSRRNVDQSHILAFVRWRKHTGQRTEYRRLPFDTDSVPKLGGMASVAAHICVCSLVC